MKTDVTKSYIDWAIRNDFQVIDVNIPKIVTVENEEVAQILSHLCGKTNRWTAGCWVHKIRRLLGSGAPDTRAGDVHLGELH